MGRAVLMVGLLASVLSTQACAKKSSFPPNHAFPPTDDGAKAMLAQFLSADADRVELSLALMPQPGDYAKVFSNSAMAEKAEAHYAGSRETVQEHPIGPKPGQTEILLWSATTDELKAGTGNANKFPGGYKSASGHLNSGLRVFRFKFVKPGETTGVAFDGLYNLEGRWVLIPKPWRFTD
jgi:hypothetical protein